MPEGVAAAGSSISARPTDALPPPRVVIENLQPVVEGGRFPTKAIVGEPLQVSADVFCDGHDLVSAAVQVRPTGVSTWVEVPMHRQEQDRFTGEVVFTSLGDHELTVVGWVDRFASWRVGARRKLDAGVLQSADCAVGAALVREAAARAEDDPTIAGELLAWAERIAGGDLHGLDDEHLTGLVHRFADREPLAIVEPAIPIAVARELARRGAWYELFPRSWGPPGRHGTLRDVCNALPYVASMGFDVLYLPPIHPVGRTNRKGPDNTPGGDEAVGSPWAIGSEAGGHTAVHPELGTIDDVRALVAEAERYGIEIAIDLAFQCSPDHPWVREHPEWFRRLPDGSIQPAENPPKRYEDVYPLDFETHEWCRLWNALESVVRFWIDQGIRVFRVDNPHTKPLAFWEWLIGRIRADRPDVIFLSEAFTRPSLMYRLAKLGFDQSYTYFAWRQTPDELRTYLTELTRTDVARYFRPNAWPNTPDILTEQLQWGGRPTFVTRFVLAATLFASYGIYGPVFELQEHVAREGVEEYARSEKYEIRSWNLDAEHTLRPLITVVNRLRHEHAALQTNETLHFHDVDNPVMLCYSKTAPPHITARSTDPVLVVVNTDPHHRQSAFVTLDLDALGVGDDAFVVHDVVGGGSYRWTGARNYVELDPAVTPVHVFVVRQHARSEQDFDYF
ncbi:MAG TPA: alpha-1,4-glucan--maltose-1-phosphate maltosyltransferase [Acidimicrobiales bacterium]